MVMNTTAVTANSHQQSTDKLTLFTKFLWQPIRLQPLLGVPGKGEKEKFDQGRLNAIRHLLYPGTQLLVSSTSATSPIIAKFIADLFTDIDEKKTILSQRTIMELF